MQPMHLFEYAVIRVVPRVEREEFLNIGVIVYCAKERFLESRYLLDLPRLAAFGSKIDVEELTGHLCSFERICNADVMAGPIGELDPASRFRWLTATRSTILQSSKVHPGLTGNAAETLERLFDQLVR